MTFNKVIMSVSTIITTATTFLEIKTDFTCFVQIFSLVQTHRTSIDIGGDVVAVVARAVVGSSVWIFLVFRDF